MTRATLRAILTFSSIAAALIAGSARSQAETGRSTKSSLQPFTVADSIRATHLIYPPEETPGSTPDFSPDGRQFFVVTERGLLESNLREYTLLVYNTNNPRTSEVVATFRSSSNRDAIVQPRWFGNEDIALIGEHPGEVPQVYQVGCRSHDVKKLTADPLGVLGFDISKDRTLVAYYAPWPGDDIENKKKEEHGFAVSDESLADLVTSRWQRPPIAYQMYLLNADDGRLRVLPGTPFQFPAGRLKIWLSPDGRYAVTEQVSSSIPATWESYGQKYIADRLKLREKKTFKIRPWGPVQAMLVDTQATTIMPLLNAPMSKDMSLSVVWSADSKSVIIAGSFLPLDGTNADDVAGFKALPAVAEVEIETHVVRSISEIPEGEYWSVRASNSPHCFVVDAWTNQAAAATSLFQFKDNRWIREDHSVRTSSNLNVSVREGLNSRPKLVETDPVTHRETVILDPNPAFDHFRFGHAEVIHWKGKRQEQLIGGLVYPTDYAPGKRYPLVIQTHGFSPDLFLLDGPFTTALAAQELANGGVFVLQIGESPLYEQAELTPDFGPVNLSQLESAVDYLVGLGIVDGNCVGLVGFSITGFSVRYALVNSTYHFAAATSAEGTDWGYWTYIAGGNASSWLAQVESAYGGTPWNGHLQAWTDNSISFNYNKIQTPLRLESDNNPGQVLNEWENFIALKRLHKPVELIYLSHGDHPVVKPFDRMASQQGNVDWLLFWLKGEEDSDPTKAEQYVRWREMRSASKSVSD